MLCACAFQSPSIVLEDLIGLKSQCMHILWHEAPKCSNAQNGQATRCGSAVDIVSLSALGSALFVHLLLKVQEELIVR